MKILIAGLGSIGRRHLRNLLALGEKDILLYRTHLATLPDDELAQFPVETDLTPALDRCPDAVIVSNPTALHLETAIPAAEMGCHILLEKPVSNTLDQVDELVSALERGGGKLLVGFQYRFHPSIQKAKQLLAGVEGEEGVIGRPVSVRAHYGEYLPGWHPWEDYRRSYSSRADLGGGVILTLSHPLDYLRYLLGDVGALWSFTGRLGDLELDVEDCAEIGLRFENGVIGSVHLDYLQQPTSRSFEIIGTKGTMRWDDASGVLSVYRAGHGSPEEWEHFPPPPGFERNSMFLAEMEHFLEVARGNVEPACTLQDGIRALEMALAARRSSQDEKLVRFGGEGN